MRTLVAIALVATVIPGLAAPGVAAAGPSINPPTIPSVPASKQTTIPRPDDAATTNALTGNQPVRADQAGSGVTTATSLSPTATWEVSEQSGDFTWTYPLRVPPAPGGFEPDLSLSYKSSTVDGRTSAANNQSSWVGEGWDLSAGFVERTYLGCASDSDGGTTVTTGDLCWRNDNATAAYGDGGGMLIRNANGEWRAKNDDGSRIERLNGANNGDNDGEYWRVTTVDGTRYLFGSQPDAKSAWTVPVFGDDAGEPCHGATFAASNCVQAYRWNLDKVIDPRGNVIRYFYNTETNNYGMNLKDAAVSYIRGGSLSRIEYGLNDNVAAGASGMVEFTTADRCVPGSDCRPESKGNWPDTPLDSRCETVTCKDKHWPSFYSTKRLASVTTKVRRGSGFTDVERWTFNQLFPDPGDGEKAGLWLKSIGHTGLAGTPIEMPVVAFEGAAMPNRVYRVSDGYAPLNRYRITGIISETGGVTSINYAAAECTPTSTPSAPEGNTMRCFPVTWSPPHHADRTDYFHKYVVGKVLESDQLSSSTQHVTSYEYLGGAAWHFDTSEFAKDAQKTWNEFRGFGRVRVRGGDAGDPSGPRTMTEQRYFRGMNGDRLPNNGTRTVNLSDSDGGSRQDHDWLQGFNLETITYANEAASSAPDPAVIGKTINDPHWQGPTATRGALKAYIVRPGTERTLTALSSGGWRIGRTVTSYDDRGLPTMIDDRGDLATAADDQCTRTTYARNTGTWLLNMPSRKETVGVNCDTTPRFPDNAIADERTSYDGKAAGEVPSAGNVTKTETADSRPASGPAYVSTGGARYDVYGRLIEYTDPMGQKATVEFTPKTGGPVIATKITSQPTAAVSSGLVTLMAVDPAYGQATVTVDQNNQVTETEYDALGRKTEVWLPNRWREEETGSYRFSYQIRKDAPPVVTTSALGPNGIYSTRNTIYDGLLRVRQVQEPAVGGGRLITDTRYDSQGREFKTTQPYFNSGAVDASLWVASDTEVPGLSRTKFDGAGRPIESIYQAGAIDRWRTTTSYGGDRVTTTPPAGGTVTTKVFDAHGQTSELRQFLAATASGSYDATSYKYTPSGHLAELTGPDNKIWRFGYDLRGRQTSSDDPDRGNAAATYDAAGRITSMRDARGVTLAYAYDSLGRKTAVHQDSLTGPKLTQWTYDTAVNGRGLLASQTRYIDGIAYTEGVSSYNALGKPLQLTVTVPSREGLLARTYNSYLGYGADGSTVTGESYPAVGDLPEETVNYTYDNTGRPLTARTAGGLQLVAGTLYNRYGEVERIEHGSTGKRAWQTMFYETNTRRLQRSIVDAEVPAPMQADLSYAYDPAGNITSISDLTIGQAPDIQCFRQDHLQRLTEAWTPTASTGCGTDPNAGALAGPAPYWNSYRYDKGGSRQTETQRSPGINATRTYTYPALQPHAVDTVSGPSGTESYDYDAAGNTISRSKNGVAETMTWNQEGQLSSITRNGQTAAFIYSADGERLFRKDSAGTTLYMGNQEVRLSSSGGSPTAVRYYTHGGKIIAARHGRSITWLAGDRQGTAQVAVNTDSMSVNRRRQQPFGAARGAAAPAWPGERGFIGGISDPASGLVHLGARDYDPTTGRFLSSDPIMDLSDPQQMQGYVYANNSPVTESDPDGMCSGPDGIGCRHKVSRQGYDWSNPAERARYEVNRNTWLNNHNARQNTLINGNGVRCADGAKTCRPSLGAVEAQRQAKAREAAARKMAEELYKKVRGPSTGSPPRSVEQLIMFLLGELSSGDIKSMSLCFETAAGFIYGIATERCENYDVKGMSHTYQEKQGWFFGGEASVGFSIKFSSDRADQIATEMKSTLSLGVDAGLGGFGSLEHEADTKSNYPEGNPTVTLKVGVGVGLNFGCACHTTHIETTGYDHYW
jgi:RHS repeat-associated protein